MHTYAIPMRWADLDSLNHVNNVVYLDYAAESRARLVDEGLLSESATIAGIAVRFQRPLMLGRTPIIVASAIDGDVLTQQICLEADGVRTVFAEVVTHHGPRSLVAAGTDLFSLPVTLRRGDLDASGEVAPVKIFELFQEARILSIAMRLDTFGPGSFVLGTSDVTLHRPIRWRTEPLAASLRVSRVGRGSFEICAELVDETTVLASSRNVLVGFDPTTQRSRPFDDHQRAQLESLVAPLRTAS